MKKLFSLLVLFISFSFIISCNKDVDDMDNCHVNDCDVCDRHFHKPHGDSTFLDDDGNQFLFSQINIDSEGKYILTDSGDKLYLAVDANGVYYLDAYNNEVYLDFEKGFMGFGLEKVIYEPLVRSGECNYIVSGKIGFEKDGETIAFIDYGDGELDEWAVKKFIGFKKGGKYCSQKGGAKHGYKPGRKFSKCCKFKQICEENISINAAESFERIQYNTLN